MTIRDTLPEMGRLISVRLDEHAEAALEELAASGLSHSEAIRTALVEAALRRRDPSLAAEAARLAADRDDRLEVENVRTFMDALRDPG
ncbi:MAG: hypothetical protein ACKVUT_01425 [Gaiella sp.]